MEKKKLNDYIVNGKLDIDRLLDDFYGYVYIIVKNSISIHITNEDMEEIISDVFIAIWKNNNLRSNIIDLKAYLSGIAKNTVKNKYRKSELNFSISDYEDEIIDNNGTEQIIENREKDFIIKACLKTLKEEEYTIFIMYYYESKSIKEIANELKCSTSKVKVILHRVRKVIKRSLEDGGYGYGK